MQSTGVILTVQAGRGGNSYAALPPQRQPVLS